MGKAEETLEMTEGTYSKGVFMAPKKMEREKSYTWTGSSTDIHNEAELEKTETTGTVGYLSQLSFSFFNKVMTKGSKGALMQRDIPFFPPFNDKYDEVTDRVSAHFQEFRKLKDKNGDPISESSALKKALKKEYGREVLMAALMYILSKCFAFGRPFLLGQLVDFFADDNADSADGYLYGNLFAVCALLDLLFLMQVFFYGINISVSMQQTLYRMVFRKTFSLAPERQEGGESTGKIVNLMSVDTEQIARFFIIGVMGVAAPLDLIVATVLLVMQIGWEGLTVWVVIIATFVWVGCFGPVIGRWQKKSLDSKDIRTKYIDETLHGMKLFKLYAWEEVLERRIRGARADEVNNLKGFYRRMFSIFSVNQCADVFFFMSIFGIYYALGKDFKLNSIFISIGLISILKQSLMMLGFFFQQYFPLTVSLNRISKFLVMKEIEEYVDDLDEDEIVFEFRNATLSWRDETSNSKDAEGGEAKNSSGSDAEVQDDFLLSKINAKIKRNLLTAIVGPVASGKSSLLNSVVGEMYLKDGKVFSNIRENETIDMLAQTHYIINGTVRENILMGMEFDEHRYVEAIRNAALIADINDSFPDADKTEIGERGITLSGGQKSRVVLARALYKQCDIYLLDDVLSAVDPDVGDEIFQRAILGQMMDTTRVLVMNSHLHNLQKCDHIIVIDAGVIQGQGKYEDLVEIFPGLMRPKTGAEERQNLEKKPTTKITKIKKASKAKKLVEEESREIGKVGGKVYLYWFSGFHKCTGPWTNIAIIFIFHVFIGVFTVAPQGFLAIWASAADGGGALFGEQSDSWYFSVWSVMNTCTVILYISSIMYCVQVALNASEQVHNDAWAGLLRSQLVHFDKNPIGRIMNRFTSDVANNDGSVVWQFQQFCFLACLLFIFVIVQVIALPYVLILIAPICFIFYWMVNYYLVTSRELQRLKALAISPIIAHFEECVNSLQIIRVCNYTDQNHEKNRKLVSNFARVNWSLLVSQRWFGIRIGFISLFVTFFLANMCVALKSHLFENAAILGLALKFSDDICTMLQFCMRIMVEWMNCMVGVERLMDTRDSEPKEAARFLPLDPPSSKWPSKGAISFNDVHFKYREELPEILKGLTFSVNPGETIGICGRTGSGKSTILLALYRMYTHIEGTIEIDGVNTFDLGLKTLRSSLSIIPQDPVILSGSLRYNLDPLEHCSDNKVKEVLKTMDFSSHFHVEDQSKILEYEVAEKGENLSAGQRQLICIARVLLQDRKIVLLDEATANIDAETDAKIQLILREFFKGKTVLTIAHRIDTIMDSDRVLLLDQGQKLEYGNPRTLIEDNGSEFSKFVKGSQI